MIVRKRITITVSYDAEKGTFPANFELGKKAFEAIGQGLLCPNKSEQQHGYSVKIESLPSKGNKEFNHEQMDHDIIKWEKSSE